MRIIKKMRNVIELNRFISNLYDLIISNFTYKQFVVHKIVKRIEFIKK